MIEICEECKQAKETACCFLNIAICADCSHKYILCEGDPACQNGVRKSEGVICQDCKIKGYKSDRNPYEKTYVP